MATGMEMMLSKMIGISPDEMKGMVEGGIGTLRTIGKTMARIETKTNMILQEKGIEYDDEKIDRENGFDETE